MKKKKYKKTINANYNSPVIMEDGRIVGYAMIQENQEFITKDGVLHEVPKTKKSK